MLATRPYLDVFTWGTAWSPDGKTIAFTTLESKKSIRSVLWAVSVGDGSVREIYSTPNHDRPSALAAGRKWPSGADWQQKPSGADW